MNDVGDAAAVSDGFLPRLAQGFHNARGNDRFPKTRPLAALTTAWSQARALSPTSVPPAVVDPGTGLPPWLSWAALLAERDLGRTLPPAASSSPPISSSSSSSSSSSKAGADDPRLKLWKRESAARLLAAAPAVPLLDIDVVMRRVEPQRALLTLVLDRADANGLFVRITVDAWVQVSSTGGVIMDDDRAQASAGLQDLLSLASHLPAPALLVRAAALDGVVVERLCRGVIGPCLHPHGGPSLAGLDDADADAFALVLGSEELSREIAATVDNDVFARDELEPLMKALPAKLRGFRAFRDAKVVASPSSSRAVRVLAKQRGTKTVVVPLPT